MESIMEKSAAFTETRSILQSDSKHIQNSQEYDKPSEYTRSIPRLVHLKLNRKQKQKQILSQIIKLFSPQEDENLVLQVLNQSYQILITNEEQSLPNLAGRLISKDESNNSFQSSLQNQVLRTRISKLKQQKYKTTFSKIKTQKQQESFQIPYQNPQKLVEELKKKNQKLQSKLNKRKQEFKNKILQLRNELTEKNEKIQKYKHKINQLQVLNQKLSKNYQNNSQSYQSFSLISQLKQKSASFTINKTESEIIINLSSPNISIQNELSNIVEQQKNKQQVYRPQIQVSKILRTLNQIKYKLTEDQKRIFRLKIAGIL